MLFVTFTVNFHHGPNYPVSTPPPKKPKSKKNDSGRPQNPSVENR